MSQVELISRKKFLKVALNDNLKIFIIHIAALEATGAANMTIPFSQTT